MIDVTMSSDGQTLIAVATKSGVDVFCQDRLEIFNGPIEWIQVAEMTIPWEDSVHQIAWLENGSLAMALSSKLVIFSKWKDATTRTPYEGSRPTSLQSIVAKVNGRLPDYHPNLLQHYLIWGKYDFIKFVFSLVHKFVKLMHEVGAGGLGNAEGNTGVVGRKVSDIPSAFWKFFEVEHSEHIQEANYDALFLEGNEFSDQFRDKNIGSFSQTHLDYLIQLGDNLKLPRLNSSDQAKLLAMMGSFVQVQQHKRSVDENGSRFVFFAKLFIATKVANEAEVLGSRDIAWAFYSDSQDYLVDFLLQCFNGNPLWKDVRSLGMGFWLKNPESLNVLLGLWKLASLHPEQGAMLKFLANDFTEERWRKAAVKNAFALLGKQRYEYAVAFFLLAERLKDAVNVCLKHLKDLQLAIVLCRLYEGENSPVLAETLKSNVLPDAFLNGDRYLISMCFTLLKQKEMALNAIMMPISTLSNTPECEISNDIIDPPLLVLHDYLQKSYKPLRIQSKVSAKSFFQSMIASSVIYENMGCPGLALDMLAKANSLTKQAVAEGILSEINKVPSKKISENTETFDWGSPVTTQSQKAAPTLIDWSIPVSQQPAAPAVIDWSTPISQQQSSTTGMDWGAPVSPQNSGIPTINNAFDWGAPISSSKNTEILDWSISEPKKVVDPLDEYEAFKASMKKPDDEEDDLDKEMRELERQLNGEPQSKSAVTIEDSQKDSIAEIDLSETQKNAIVKIQTRIKYQEWKMAIRMIHSLYKSMAVVSLNMDILSSELVFKDYFKLTHTGVQKLTERVQMPSQVMDEVLTIRFKEMDAFVAFVELPGLAAGRTASSFSALLIEGSNHLSSMIFSSNFNADVIRVDPIVDFAKRLLWSIICWYEKEETGFAPIGLSVMSQTAATAFLALSVSCIRSKDFRSLWWIVGLSDRFFEVLVGGAKKKNLKPLILDLLTQREPIIQPDSESDDDSDSDFYGENTAEKSLLAEELLLSVALQHIGLDFQVFVRHLKDGGNVDEAYGFLSEVVLTKLSSLLFDMHNNVREKWTEKTKFKIAKLSTYLLNNYSKGVWALIKRTANVKKLAREIVSDSLLGDKPVEAPVTSSVPILLTQDENPEVFEDISPSKKSVHYYDETSYEIVFRTKDIIGTFAINPLDQNCFAVATHDTIVEFDLETSILFNSRKEVLAKRRESVDDLAIKSLNRFLEPKNPHLQRTSDTENIRRNLSYDSLQKAVKDSMMDLRRRDSDLDSGRRIHREVGSVSSLEAHPTLNYCKYSLICILFNLAGVGDGNSESIVKLYQFGQKGDLVSYASGTSARITKCRFDPFGGRFGCSDAKGELRLWKFDATEQALHPTQVLSCNSAITNDFVFVNSSTLIATAGVSSNG
ncbi:regulator of (H+)-ATPase in vacuolar membrane, partial [Physocladia obscura]